MIPNRPSDSMWTMEQWQAINDSGHNIIVSAGAGSGKTAVLSERVITNLKNGMHIDELLLLTFTKAAASEMKERIRKKIKKESSLCKELDLIDTAYITTFDSFALSVVKKYHYLLNLSPNIAITDSTIIDIKRREFLDVLFDKYYEEKNSDFLKLIGDFCVKDDADIKKAIIKINSKLEMLPNKNIYLNEYMSNFFDDEKIKKDILEYINIIKNKFLEINSLIDDLSYYVDEEYITKLNDSLYNLLNCDNYDDVVNNLNVKLPMLPRNTEEEAKSIKEDISSILKEVKELCTYNDIDDIKNTILLTKDNICVIIKIIKDLDKLVFDYKFNLDIYEFNDIALMAIKILEENDEVREEMKYHFKEIMIDEYQDTNDLQESFISLIENDNVYMVGDIKQSIYRFRNANPDIFKNKYDNYSLNNGGVKIDLNKNFRSRKEVLDNINLIFNSVMDNVYGGANYLESHQMVFGNESYIKKGSTNQNNNFEVYSYDYDRSLGFDKEEIECFIIANDIKNKVLNKYQVFDKDEGILRDISYKDFVILIDRTTSFDLYKKIFEYMKIPLSLYKDESMNKDDDVLVLRNVINFVIKVKEKIFDTEFKYLFVSILRSFLYEYDDNDIFNYFINNNFKNSDLYNRALNISNDIYSLSNYELLVRIINEFDYYNKLIKIGNINSSIKKLDKLFDSAASLSMMGYDVYDFLEYLKEMTSDNNDYDIKYSVNMVSSDSVKIMTIHKSKGLEYHICYFSSLYKSFNTSDIKDRFMYDKNYGIISPYFNEGIGNTIYKELLKNNYMVDEISEKIRLFYVALTRAKEKMIMVLPSSDKYNNSSSVSVLSNSIRSKYKCLADIMYSIYGITFDYYTSIDISKLGLSKDYNLIKKSNYKDNIPKCSDKLFVNDVVIDNKIINKETFSKHNNNLISIEIRNNMDFGLFMHEVLENIDLCNPDYNNLDDNTIKYVKMFISQDILKKINEAKIYHEYEFIYNDNNIEYHGIIDLMLEYNNYIDIIDYKLKDISDNNYVKQLMGYKEYIENKTKKKVNIYLYSILEGKTKKID